ncbi:uncharacterized mitochondrial protein AtMg00810-like [Diospyros lotus]|uniref:uncharacterized mitochondrial protein AtMg00810-like n=1 Tax=Diospyros lotus TaxID=55363 RepID=UPI002257469B|nr:uncharacterized mitochondrial protein AtMg00810-like [Diospyros lotus]
MVPMILNVKLCPTEGDLLEDVSAYRRLNGGLFYLTIFFPDITYVVHKLSQYVSKPRKPHLDIVHHLLKYLKAFPGQGLLFSISFSLKIQTFSDADWGSFLNIRRSITGFCIFLGDSWISWRDKKQITVSRSSAEAEYKALASTASEVMWLHQLLIDLKVSPITLALLFCDN